MMVKMTIEMSLQLAKHLTQLAQREVVVAGVVGLSGGDTSCTW